MTLQELIAGQKNIDQKFAELFPDESAVIFAEDAQAHKNRIDQLDENFQTIKKLEADMDTMRSNLFKGSIQLEDSKKEVAISHAFLDVFLDEFEALFDYHGYAESEAIATHYLAAAAHRRKQGRTGDRIEAVQAWVDGGCIKHAITI